MKLNLPTILTIFRLILVPFFVFTFYAPFSLANFLTALIFLIASVTDWVDGYLARKWKQITQFGTFLDPVADKIIVTTALILIAERYHVWWISIPVIIIILREIAVSALREWMAKIGSQDEVSVSWAGKVKTALQMTALTLLLWNPYPWIESIGFICFYLAVILTLYSMYQYLIISLRHFK